jgi:HAD superfamily hydrolase (TIGR01459 family)
MARKAAKDRERDLTQIVQSLSEISGRYDALFCDLWGCLHDGKRVFPAAVAALQAYRQTGGRVVLLTNAARPNADVARQIADLGAPRDCYDIVVSSGDAAQAAMASGAFGRKVHFIGPDRDLTFFRHADGSGIAVERVALDQAEGVVCTGLVNDRTETPDDYRAVLLQAKTRGLKLLCANPDIVVDIGAQRIFCAGALAAAYSAIGGESFYFGKPHAPIYDLARRRMAEMGADARHVLCVGDGIHTDISGGMGEDLDTLFVTGGLAAEATGTRGDQPDPALLDTFLAEAQLSPTAAIGTLR